MIGYREVDCNIWSECERKLVQIVGLLLRCFGVWLCMNIEFLLYCLCILVMIFDACFVVGS